MTIKSFVDKCVWTDVSTFYLNGHICSHNAICWARHRPLYTLQISQSIGKVNVWMGICSKGVVCPIFFEDPLTGAIYRDEILPQALELLDK